jgi:hypothetical protein
MADPRVFELDELLIRPGTYFNPQTEVLVVVDDSPDMDSEIFNLEAYEGADWVLVSDDLAIDENRRDELLESFQVSYHPGSSGAISADRDDDAADELETDDQDVGREDLEEEDDGADEVDDEVGEL